ncbi:Ku protein [Aestuariivirga litoralis]|uniref:Non-homologous end joining protein Ku n=1 Tax=Aestuariivirga litoralis TaxID=2650924 RepID=A0A2W2AZ91_9HYPH|nr:Ku protein [Aestuariivirga litoralis]PZF77960.1 Ku protein [Aestuariivirga litoralis]
MAARAYWKGFLRLSLVSIAVEVFNAEDRKADLSFHQIHKPTGKRIHHAKTAEGVGEVAAKDIVSGYEIEKGEYVIMAPDEIDAVKLESKRTIELSQFVPLAEVDPRYFEQPYYVTPGDEHAAEGYLVIREALRKTGTIGIGQLTAQGREHLIGVAPLDQGLMLNRLRYAGEVRPIAEFFSDLPKLKLDHEMVDLVTELIGRKQGRFRPEAFEDHYETELRKLIQRKAKGETIVSEPEEEAPKGNVINLMDALRDSLNKGGGGKPAAARKAAPKRKAEPKRKAAPRRRAKGA